MRRQIYTAIGFPLFLITLLAAERIATFLLGIYPSSIALWAASIELRSLCRIITSWLELATGGSLFLQFILIAVLAISVCLFAQTRRGPAISFVINHGALLMVGAATMLANGVDFASSDPNTIAPLSFIPYHSLHLNWLHATVFATGLSACLYCHIIYIAELRRRTGAVSARLRELSLGLADKRSA